MTKAELEARVAELEEKLKAVMDDWNAAVAQNEELVLKNKELLEAAEELKADNQDAPVDVPPVQVAQYDPTLLASCVGVLRDRMTGATISEDEFNQLAPMFVKQAKDLYQMLLA